MREFLKGLELEKEKIDSIMAEHGKYLSAEKEKAENLQNEIKSLKAEAVDFKKTIDGLNNTIEENNKTLENLQNVTNENNDLKAQLQMSDSNVKKEFSKFVTSEIMAKVDDEHDFVSVLEGYKKDNPQYFGDVVVKKVQSSPSLNVGGKQPQTTNDIMNDILRGAGHNN